LSHLCCELPELRERLYVAGACPVIVKVIKSFPEDMWVQETAAEAIVNMTVHHHGNQTEMGGSGAVEALLASMSRFPKERALVDQISAALGNLTEDHEGNQQLLRGATDCWRHLSKALVEFKFDREIVEQVCETVKNLVENCPEACSDAIRGGVLMALQGIPNDHEYDSDIVLRVRRMLEGSSHGEEEEDDQALMGVGGKEEKEEEAPSQHYGEGTVEEDEDETSKEDGEAGGDEHGGSTEDKGETEGDYERLLDSDDDKTMEDAEAEMAMPGESGIAEQEVLFGDEISDEISWHSNDTVELEMIDAEAQNDTVANMEEVGESSGIEGKESPLIGLAIEEHESDETHVSAVVAQACRDSHQSRGDAVDDTKMKQSSPVMNAERRDEDHQGQEGDRRKRMKLSGEAEGMEDGAVVTTDNASTSDTSREEALRQKQERKRLRTVFRATVDRHVNEVRERLLTVYPLLEDGSFWRGEREGGAADGCFFFSPKFC